MYTPRGAVEVLKKVVAAAPPHLKKLTKTNTHPKVTLKLISLPPPFTFTQLTNTLLSLSTILLQVVQNKVTTVSPNIHCFTAIQKKRRLCVYTNVSLLRIHATFLEINLSIKKRRLRVYVSALRLCIHNVREFRLMRAKLFSFFFPPQTLVNLGFCIHVRIVSCKHLATAPTYTHRNRSVTAPYYG